MRSTFVGYEYQSVTVKHNVASMCADGYENFGWALENTGQPAGKVDSITLKFKRDRKIDHKVELTRLQRHFDACLNEVERLESSKTSMARMTAMSVGIVGTVFMAGAVFSYIGGMLPLTIILAVPAFVGWALPYLLYRKTLSKKTEQTAPMLNEKFDEMDSVCEKASMLLAS